MVLTHFCYSCMVLSSIQADRITFLTSSTDYLLAARHSAGLILAADCSMLCDQCKGWVSWRMAVPHSSCAVTPWTGMGCRRAVDAGPSSSQGCWPGDLCAAGTWPGSGCWRRPRLQVAQGHPFPFLSCSSQGVPDTTTCPKEGSGMRKSTAAGWVPPNLHGSQRPLWKGLYKIVILSHFYFPSTLIA